MDPTDWPVTIFDTDIGTTRPTVKPIELTEEGDTAESLTRMVKLYQYNHLRGCNVSLLRTLLERFSEQVTQQEPNFPMLFIYSVIFQNGQLSLTMEDYPSETLESLLSRRRHLAAEQGLRGLPEKVAIAILRQAVLAVDFLHSASSLNMSHRNVHPGAIILYRRLDAWIVKLVDPTAACILVANSHHSYRNFYRYYAGKLRYLAPEILELYSVPASPLDASSHKKADIWSLGLLLYEALHGSLPFDCASMAGNPQEVYGSQLGIVQKDPRACSAINTSPAIGQLIIDQLQVNPANRPDTATILRRLEKYQPTASDFAALEGGVSR